MALIVFGLLVALFVIVATVCLFGASRSLNVTANKLDDVLGDMDGYTVIVYEGTVAADSSEDAEDEGSTLEEVAASYEEKGAEVLVLRTSELSYYEDGLIIQCGEYRVGVFSVDIYTLRREVEAKIDYFTTYGVDYLIVLTPHSALVSGFSEIDIVISTRDGDPGTSGEMTDGVFFVSVPSSGSFGVIVISPSDVISSKVLKTL